MASADAPRALTVKTATAQWIETTRAIEGLRQVQQDAAAFLLDKARQSGRRTFGDEIAVVQTGGSLVLDQAAAKEQLLEDGHAIDGFMKRTKSGLALKLLK